ncbi:MAG TPA: hypothetical protein VHS34_02370 [Terriglobales bacterium]|jgi:hypothetical protein|nr:hypothetical protein [Terriglobales bacterium]
MKNQMFALLGLGLLLAAASAYAQTGAVKANVPFNFVVDKADFPAGQYTLVSFGSSGALMTIQSSDGRIIKAIIPNDCESGQTQRKTKLVFHRYRDHYFLAQVWMAGSDRGRQLLHSQRENEMALNYPAQNVVVVATLR